MFLIENGFVQVIEVVGLFDRQGNCNLDQALSRYSWRFKVNRLLLGLPRPTIQQIQQHLKEVHFVGYGYFLGTDMHLLGFYRDSMHYLLQRSSVLLHGDILQ